MPHYFFDTFNGDSWIDDDEGFDCENDGAARAEAHGGLGDIAYDEVPTGADRVMMVRVRDEEGLLLETHLDLHTIWLR